MDAGFRTARAGDARDRAKLLEPADGVTGHPPPKLLKHSGGGSLSMRQVAGHAQVWLNDQPLASGAAIELFTNACDGWLRGRLAWSGRVEDPPRMQVPAWNPDGPWNEEGLPPFVGNLDFVIPAQAICRRPKS